MATCRIEIENLNSAPQQSMGGSVAPVQLQSTMPEPLRAVMGEFAWETFKSEVNSAITEPAAELQSKQKCTRNIFVVMIVAFFTGFLSGPLSAALRVPELMPFFFTPFLVWPPSFILIFCIGCQTASITERLTTALREVLERQSAANQGVSFHLREETFVTYGRKHSHTHTVHYIEASFMPTGGGGSAVASPGSWFGSMTGAGNGYSPVAGSGSIADRMKTLDDLKRQGLISEVEFDNKRKELLSQV